jgi:SAM-dependent methyltransferase
VSRDFERHYESADESSRLREGVGALEFARSAEIVRRLLPEGKARILDIGGGPGAYASWLLGLGHEVHLLDPVLRHVREARARGIASSVVGDARALPFRGEPVDLVLLQGPLYHLTERSDRLSALREAASMLRPGGAIAAAAISRYASLLDGLLRGFWNDPDFRGILAQDLASGQHRNETSRLDFFTTAFFHRPQELRDELLEAGFLSVQILPVEGPGWLAKGIASLGADPELLALLRRLEGDESLLVLSAHLLGIGRAPA